MLPTGAPVNATVAQQVCCFAAHLLCSMRQKPTAFGAKEHSCGRLTSPTGVRRRTGPLALCSMHQKCFALLVLRSMTVGDSRLPRSCDVGKAYGFSSLRSKAPSGLCDVAQVCCFAAHLCSIGAFPFGGMRPRTCEGPFKALRMCSFLRSQGAPLPAPSGAKAVGFCDENHVRGRRGHKGLSLRLSPYGRPLRGGSSAGGAQPYTRFR